MKKLQGGEGGMPLETNQKNEGKEEQETVHITEVPMHSAGQGEPIQDKVGDRPEFRVVQPEVDKDGKIVYKDVGAIWKNVSKAGNEFYTMKIGKLRLLIFKNRAIGE